MSTVARYNGPAGCVVLTVRDGKLVGVKLDGPCTAKPTPPDAESRPWVEALERYFNTGHTDVPPGRIDVAGCSDFDRAVYAELCKVPSGALVTYGELARRIDRPGAAQAVGGAMGRNPVPIFVPCHRVVAAGGRLGGFGAGLSWKRKLLEIEGWHIDKDKVKRDE